MEEAEEIVYGMPTLIELEGSEQNSRLCQSLGLNFIELNMNLPEYQVERLYLDQRRLSRLAEHYGHGYTLHLPENFDMAPFSEPLRLVWLDEFKRTAEMAQNLSVPIINFHMAEGIHFKLPGQKVHLYERYQDTYLEGIRAFRELVDSEFGKKKAETMLTIENTGIYHLPFVVEAVNQLLESPHFALTWDVGHDHCAEGRDTDFLISRRDKIVHLHLHDAKGATNHLALGTGELDYAKHLEFARLKSCRCVLETKSVEGLKASVQVLKTQSQCV